MNANNRPRKPDDSHRVAIIGQNGSGKTVAGAFQLSGRSYDRMPWIIVNYKGDEYLDEIPGVEEIGPGDKIPEYPGLYTVRPPPDDGTLDPLLMRAHRRGGGVGFYIDEGYCVGAHSQAFRLVLTQGRSLRIPVITLTQRPVWMSKFVMSESNFFQVFHLNAAADRKTIAEYLPVDVNYTETLPEYQSLYFDAGKRRLVTMGPVPFGQEVLDIFDRRRPKKVSRLG